MKWVYRIVIGLFIACVILSLSKSSNFAPAPTPSVADISLSTPPPIPSNDAVTTPETPADIALKNPASPAPPPYSPLMSTPPVPDDKALINPQAAPIDALEAQSFLLQQIVMQQPGAASWPSGPAVMAMSGVPSAQF